MAEPVTRPRPESLPPAFPAHMPILNSLLAAALATAEPGSSETRPPLPHSSAIVNHSLSHGTLGDRFLSLNEAIQLHNGVLTYQQLSAGEQGQLSGQQDVAFIDIDARQLPFLVMERPLDAIVDTPHGCVISGVAGVPRLDFAGRAVGFTANSNFCAFQDLEITNAQVGIALVQRPGARLGGASCNLRRLRFSNIGSTGIRMAMLQGNAAGDVTMDFCHFEGVPVAMSIDESSSGWSSRIRLSDVTVTGAQTAFRARLGAGGASLYTLERFDVQASGPGILIERPLGGDRLLLCEAISVRSVGAPAFAVEGSSQATTQVLLSQVDATLAPGANGAAAVALALGPLGAQIEGHLRDSRIEGDAIVEAGGAQPMVVDNVLHRNGRFRMGGQGAGLGLERVRFHDATIGTVGALPVAMTDCCILGASSVGGTAAAPVSLTDSYLAVPPGNQVQVVSPLAQAQLGAFDVTPARPALGGSITVTSDLPPGFVGFAVLGTSRFGPQPGPYPLYYDGFGAVTLGAVFGLQQSFPVAIPANGALVGTAWAVQMLVVPGASVTPSPSIFPPARRFSVW